MVAVHERDLTVARRAIRGLVCPGCSRRPARSENWGPRLRRNCEVGCPVFANLTKLLRIAECVNTARPGAQDRAVKHLVCQTCRCSPDAGDYCADRVACTCPLVIATETVLGVLEKVVDHERRARLARVRARLMNVEG